jgi:hypothetical protein
VPISTTDKDGNNIIFTDENWEKEVLNSKDPVIVFITISEEAQLAPQVGFASAGIIAKPPALTPIPANPDLRLSKYKKFYDYIISVADIGKAGTLYIDEASGKGSGRSIAKTYGVGSGGLDEKYYSAKDIVLLASKALAGDLSAAGDVPPLKDKIGQCLPEPLTIIFQGGNSNKLQPWSSPEAPKVYDSKHINELISNSPILLTKLAPFWP